MVVLERAGGWGEGQGRNVVEWPALTSCTLISEQYRNSLSLWEGPPYPQSTGKLSSLVRRRYRVVDWNS